MAGLAAAGATLLLKLDLTDDASIVAAVNTIKNEARRIDVLVNNAGYGSYGALEDVPLDEGRRQFEVNVFGLARLCQLVLPMMRAQKSLNVTSIGGKIWEPLGGWYHATKFAVEGLSDCLRVEVAPFGVDAIVIKPGAIRTEWAGIARDGLLQMSGGSAYAELAKRHARMLATADTSSPSTIGLKSRSASASIWTWPLNGSMPVCSSAKSWSPIVNATSTGKAWRSCSGQRRPDRESSARASSRRTIASQTLPSLKFSMGKPFRHNFGRMMARASA
jgi:NAD(P)-dependent dehydrogenase (short-subunit alcohol dehydrogenase family)